MGETADDFRVPANGCRLTLRDWLKLCYGWDFERVFREIRIYERKTAVYAPIRHDRCRVGDFLEYLDRAGPDTGLRTVGADVVHGHHEFLVVDRRRVAVTIRHLRDAVVLGDG